jgi:endonuclease/exonuclease/phosphatase family metal-dependent hydrolase
MSMSLKVMTYNIRCGVNMSGQLDLRAIADLIRQESPDVAGIQEVDRHFAERSRFVDQAAWLAAELGCHYAYGVNVDKPPIQQGQPRRQYGTALFSKHPITFSRNVHLSSFGNEQRGIMEASFVKEGRAVSVYNTHFGLTREERLQQAEESIQLLDRSADVRILVGDFNSEPSSPEIQRLLGAGMRDACQAVANGLTFPSDEPGRRIDYIFYSGELRLDKAYTLSSLASDHRPIVAEFTIGD